MSDQQQAETAQDTTEAKSAENVLYGDSSEELEPKEETTEPEVDTDESTEGEEVKEEKADEAQTEFELKMPENTLLSESVIDEIASIAKEQGLSGEQAQKMLDMQSKAVSGYSEQIIEQFNEQVEAWGEEIKADKEIGGDNLGKNVELAKRAVTAFAGEEFVKELDQTGYGNHPKLFKMLVNIGKELQADDMVLSNAQSNEPKSFADAFYPKQNN